MNVNPNKGAEQFLREKTVTTYEHSTYVTDTASGEIISTATEAAKKVASEPDFIKVYYRAMMAVQGIDEIPLDFLLALSSQLGYINEDSPLLFYNNRTTRRAIADYCRIGDNMVTKYIKRSVTKGVLFATADRGTYEVNPWLIARGRWSSIRKLQANYEFVSGSWTRTATYALQPAEDEPQQKPDTTQLPGQMSISDLPDMQVQEAVNG